MNLAHKQEYIIKLCKDLCENEILVIQDCMDNGKISILFEAVMENLNVKFCV